MENTITRVLVGCLAICLLILSYIGLGKVTNSPIIGSADVGSEYYATTTAPGGTAVRVLKSGYGTLGSVVITGDNTGTISIYNATTSDVTKRTGNKASSTILIAEIPASTPEETYTYDVSFSDGLLISGVGNAPTSSITWR